MEWIFDIRDGTHDSPKYVTEGVPLITSKNLCETGLDFTTAKKISVEDSIKINARSKVDNGDILFAMIGTIGNPVIVNEIQPFSIKNMALFKQISKNTNFEYLLYFLLLAQDWMKAQATGGVQSFVSLSSLREYLFPFPPQKEQERISNAIKKCIKEIAS